MKLFNICAAGALILLTLTQCQNDPFAVDISNSNLEIQYNNIDSVLSNDAPAEVAAYLTKEFKRIPNVIAYQTGYCMEIGMVSDSSFLGNLSVYKANPYIKRVEQRIKEKFHDLPGRHEQITDGFKRLKVHLPKAPMPNEILYTNSKFASSAFCTKKELTIGLERYLGYKTDVIQELPPNLFYDWMKKAFEAEYLERDAICAWILTHITPEKENCNNIEAIIQWGKILVLTEAAFPELPKNTILRYSEKNYQWALDNERPFWDYLVKQKLLFSSSEADQMNLLHEAPFTAGLPMNEAPDRLGQFLGWRIVHSYMEQNDVTLQELIELPYTEILTYYEINE